MPLWLFARPRTGAQRSAQMHEVGTNRRNEKETRVRTDSLAQPQNVAQLFLASGLVRTAAL